MNFDRRRAKLKVWLISVLCVIFTAGGAFSQERSTTDPVLERLRLGPGYGNCASNTATLDYVRSEALLADGEDSTVIAIARLGRGEMSRELNRRRLYTIQTYLIAKGVPPQMLVTAEGERVSGYGRVDFYVHGKLFAALTADRCRDLPVDNCIEDFYVGPYYLPRRGRTSWCR